MVFVGPFQHRTFCSSCACASPQLCGSVGHWPPTWQPWGQPAEGQGQGCHSALAGSSHSLGDTAPAGCAQRGLNRGLGTVPRKGKGEREQPAGAPRALPRAGSSPGSRAGLLPHYLLDINITLAVREDYVRASLLPQLLQNLRLPAGISQIRLVQHQDVRADAQRLLQRGVTARQRNVAALRTVTARA